MNINELVKEKSIKHIAIIMDGNGRWAEKKGLKRTEGHKVGADRVIDIVEACDDFGIEHLSLYAFSTENWKRPISEVSLIMDLLNKFINSQLDRLHKKNVKLNIMGDISALSFVNRKAVEYAVNKTKNNTGLVLNVGINYGSRAEIVNSLKLIYEKIKLGEINLEDVNENLISENLYTKNSPDPDVVIRTGGEKRVSNFMLYQLAYSEFYFTDILWPDFNKEEFKNSILDFVKRDRSFGGLNE